VKKKIEILPKVPRIPGDLDSVKLREFFNWKNHELITRHEVEKMLERFQKEVMESIFSKINDSESVVKGVKEELSKSYKEFEKNVFDEVKNLKSEMNESLENIETEVKGELKKRVGELENHHKESEEMLMTQDAKLNDALNTRISKIKEGSEIKINNLSGLLNEKLEKYNGELVEKNSELRNTLIDIIENKFNLSREDGVEMEKRMKSFTTNLITEKFEFLNNKLLELNTKFLEFKEGNDMELIEKEFEKKTKELETSFNQFENISDGLNEEIKAEIKDLRDTWFPEFKQDIKQDLETFKTEVNDKFKNMDPNAIAQASEERMNDKIKDLNLLIEDIQQSLNIINNVVTKEEFEELHENFKKQMKKVIDWINYFDGKN
jgi:hypothetical protein